VFTRLHNYFSAGSATMRTKLWRVREGRSQIIGPANNDLLPSPAGLRFVATPRAAALSQRGETDDAIS